jgi:hypothetical protein
MVIGFCCLMNILRCAGINCSLAVAVIFVLLVRDVCGYPSTVHGGLTAAIVSATFQAVLHSF